MALLVAMVAASAIAVAFPISRTRASAQGPETSAAHGGLTGAILAHAQTVSEILATPGLGGQSDASGRGSSRLVPEPLLAAALDVALGQAFGAPGAAVSAGTAPATRFTLHEGGFSSVQESAGPTVGEALSALGIGLTGADALSPAGDAPLAPGMHVYLERATAVRLSVGGESREVFTRSHTVRGMLSELGVTLDPLDKVFPGLDARVERDMRVNVTTVRDTIEFIEDPIEFETVYAYDPDIYEGRQVLVQEGSDGHFRREFKVRRVDGVEISRETVAETILAPTEAIVAIGTYVEPVATPEPVRMPTWLPPAPDGPVDCVATMNVFATWYTAESAGGGGLTATGVPVQRGIVAVDPSVIPLGTSMYIPGYGYGVAADTGGGIIGDMIDLGFGADDVYDWHTRRVDICILG